MASDVKPNSLAERKHYLVLPLTGTRCTVTVPELRVGRFCSKIYL